MRYCDILLHLTADNRSTEKTVLAFNLAKAFNARVNAVYTLPLPSQIYYMGDYVPAEFFVQQMEDARQEAAKIRKAFEATAIAEGIAVGWVETDIPPLEALRASGHIRDLVIIGQPNPEHDVFGNGNLGVDALCGDLALAIGRPVLILPYIGKYPNPGSTVVIAWNSTREAARAVHDALPLLLRAKSVIVLTIDPSDEQRNSAAGLIDHLAHYGIAAKTNTTTAKDISAGDILLSTLADYSADLLVMGAYGHSRVRETVFGGVTATILNSMTVPVLLSN